MTDREALDASFADIRERGYSVDRGEFFAGVCCLSVPLGDAMVAPSLWAPSARFADCFDEYLRIAFAVAAASVAPMAQVQ